MNTSDFSNSIQRIYRIAENSAANLSTVALILTMALVTWSSISRYLFNEPVKETRPFAILYLLVAIIFLSFPRLQRQENNINVSFLYDRVSRRTQIAFDMISRVSGLAFILVICYISLSEVVQAYQTNWHTTGAVEVPMSASFALMAIGLAVLTAILLIQIMKDIKDMAAVI